MIDESVSSRLRELFEAALSDYEMQTNICLEKHQFADQLRDCYSIESVTTFFQKQVRACSEIQGIDRIMESLSRVLSVLSSISANFDNFGLSFPLVRIIYVGLAVLLATIMDIRTLNPVVDLLESIQSLLKHLDIYNKVPPTAAITGVVVKTLVELLSILARATNLINQGRPEKMVRTPSRWKYDEMVLERLDRLTLDESRIIAARILEVVHGLVLHMKYDKASIIRVYDAQMSDADKAKRDKLQQNVRRWLSPPDPLINYKIARESRNKGTATWLLQSDTFSEWILSEPSSLLWIHGKPGAGKSVLCSAIIEVIETMRRAGLASLAFFYCDFRDDRKKDLRGLVSSLLVQLCHQSDSYCGMVLKLYSEHARGSRYPSDDSLVLCLESILKLSGQAPIFLIVDALDECPITSDFPSPREKVLTLVKQFMISRYPNLRICVTSRPEIDLRVVLVPLSFCSVSLNDESGQREDIVRYIKSVVHTDPIIQAWRASDKELLIDVLTHNANGVFLWVSCQFVYLRRCPRKHIQRALNNLPETLDGTYPRALRDINKADRALAQRLFSCISVARRPLRANELTELLALNVEAGPFRLFRMGWRQKDLVDAVRSTYSNFLAIVDIGDSPIVQFLHASVQEFLEGDRLAQASDEISRYYVSRTTAHTLVAQVCLDVLLRLDSKLITRDNVRGSPLAEYASEHWVEHARFGNGSQNVEGRMKHLFDPRKPHLSVCLSIHIPEVPRCMRLGRAERPSLDLPLTGTPLHYASLWGLLTIVEFLVIEHSQDIHSRSFTSFMTPLHLAAEKGHVEIACFLVESGAGTRAKDKDRSTPLHLASREGQLEVTRLLLEWRADVRARDKDGSTPLHLASREGQLGVARSLLDYRADIGAQNANSSTPLHLASREGQLEITRLLIDHRADVDAQDMNRSTPLHLASQEGELEVVSFLIEEGADVTARDKDGWTALHLASREGRLEVARYLIDHGADVDSRSMDRSTPLHLALREGQMEVARILIDHNVDVNARDRNGWTPIYLALREGHLEVARFLIDYCADMSRLTLLYLALRGGRREVALTLIRPDADVDHSTLLRSTRGHRVELARILIDYGADAGTRDVGRSTPLHLALREGQLEVACFLIDYGADVNAQDINRSSPLHVASQEGQVEVARILLQHGADSDARDSDNCTSLHWASQLGHLAVVRVLVEHGTDVNSRDTSNWTPLHGASQNDHLEVVRFLLMRGADVHALDLGGWTSLQLASCNGYFRTVLLLLEHRADANTRDNSSWTPLHCASRWGHRYVVEDLLWYGANVNARDNNNWTPLHYASRWGHWRVVQILLSLGADMNARDNNSWTPLHYASLRAREGAIHILLEYRADVNFGGDGNQTPLHLASRAGHLRIVDVLVKNEANIHVRNHQGRTPLEEASVNGHHDVVKLLLKYGAGKEV